MHAVFPSKGGVLLSISPLNNEATVTYSHASSQASLSRSEIVNSNIHQLMLSSIPSPSKVQLSAIKTAMLDACQFHITYTLTLINTGNEAANHLKIQELLPNEVYLPNVNGLINEGIIEVEGAAFVSGTFPTIDSDNLLCFWLTLVPAGKPAQPGIVRVLIHGQIIS